MVVSAAVAYARPLAPNICGCEQQQQWAQWKASLEHEWHMGHDAKHAMSAMLNWKRQRCARHAQCVCARVWVKQMALYMRMDVPVQLRAHCKRTAANACILQVRGRRHKRWGTGEIGC